MLGAGWSSATWAGMDTVDTPWRAGMMSKVFLELIEISLNPSRPLLTSLPVTNVGWSRTVTDSTRCIIALFYGAVLSQRSSDCGSLEGSDAASEAHNTPHIHVHVHTARASARAGLLITTTRCEPVK